MYCNKSIISYLEKHHCYFDARQYRYSWTSHLLPPREFIRIARVYGIIHEEKIARYKRLFDKWRYEKQVKAGKLFKL